MSRLRPCLATTNKPVTVSGVNAYYCIYNAVSQEPGLVHGKLHDRGAHCAIGSYFAAVPSATLYESFIDEVAAINDSVPHVSKEERKQVVLRWLKWKLQQAGFTFKGRPLKSPR